MFEHKDPDISAYEAHAFNVVGDRIINDYLMQLAGTYFYTNGSITMTLRSVGKNNLAHTFRTGNKEFTWGIYIWVELGCSVY